jgi:3-deoxy-D-manno-octulosonic-acid transferase/heptosyltransferase-1
LKILIVKLSAIGDVIHTLPALNAIRKRYPGAYITWVVESAAAALVQNHRALDRVIVSRRKEWMRQLKGPGRRQVLGEIRSFVGELRDTRYDVVIDFHALLKSALLVLLAKGRRKIGFDRGMEHTEHSHLVLNERVAPVDMSVHALTRQLILCEAIGVHSRKVVYDIPISPEDDGRVDALLSDAGVDPARPLVAVNPVALWETKLWFNDRFAELADRLVTEAGAAVVFTGGKADGPPIREILGRMKRPASDLTGKTSLTTLAALYRRAACVVSTDTGPMHLAAAVGTPVVALFGPTAPWRTGPFGDIHRVIRTAPACAPCFKRRCEGEAHRCMAEIPVERVRAAVAQLLGASRE